MILKSKWDFRCKICSTELILSTPIFALVLHQFWSNRWSVRLILTVQSYIQAAPFPLSSSSQFSSWSQYLRLHCHKWLVLYWGASSCEQGSKTNLPTGKDQGAQFWDVYSLQLVAGGILQDKTAFGDYKSTKMGNLQSNPQSSLLFLQRVLQLKHQLSI